MSKKIILPLCILFTLSTLCAQENQSLPVDQHGKITFMTVVDVPQTNRRLLVNNALDYLQSHANNPKDFQRDLVITPDSSEMSLGVSYTLYRDFPIRSPHGLMKYSLAIAVKEGRYRFMATDFVFHYLKRNRYGRFVEVKGKSKELETPHFKGHQQQWDRYKQQLHSHMVELQATLKQQMLNPQNVVLQEAVTIDDDW